MSSTSRSDIAGSTNQEIIMTTPKAYSPETIKEVESVESILIKARDSASSSAVFCAYNAAIGAMWQAIAKHTLV